MTSTITIQITCFTAIFEPPIIKDENKRMSCEIPERFHRTKNKNVKILPIGLDREAEVTGGGVYEDPYVPVAPKSDVLVIVTLNGSSPGT